MGNFSKVLGIRWGQALRCRCPQATRTSDGYVSEGWMKQGDPLGPRVDVWWVGEGGGEMRTQQACWAGEVVESSVQWQNIFPLAGVV